jgi:DNA-binding XRE family transcriptional regulator
MLGEIAIPATGKSKAEIARLLGISRQTLYDILNLKQPVTPAVAVRLGKLFGDGQVSGSGCRLLMTLGMPSATSTMAASRSLKVASDWFWRPARIG